MTSEPLYPAYLPTRADGYVAPIEVAPFDGDEPGLRADPSKPSLLKAGVSVVDITPRIGAEIRGVQISELGKQGLDEVALLAAERGVLVFVSSRSLSVLPENQMINIQGRGTKTLQMSASISSVRL